MLKRAFYIQNTCKKTSTIRVAYVVLVVALGMMLAACSSGKAQTQTVLAAAAVGDIIQFGGAEWRVLELQADKALVISDKVLLERTYNPSSEISMWAECELRQYLNGEFYETTFSGQEKKQIVETAVKTGDNPWYLTSAGSETKDKVFLLSIEEALQYFGDSGELANWRVGVNSINDQFNQGRMAKTAEGKAVLWWLRSPGLDYQACENLFSCAASVAADGSLGIGGEFVNNKGGVRPALWLQL